MKTSLEDDAFVDVNTLTEEQKKKYWAKQEIRDNKNLMPFK